MHMYCQWIIFDDIHVNVLSLNRNSIFEKIMKSKRHDLQIVITTRKWDNILLDFKNKFNAKLLIRKLSEAISFSEMSIHISKGKYNLLNVIEELKSQNHNILIILTKNSSYWNSLQLTLSEYRNAKGE